MSDSLSYALMRERLRVLSTPPGRDAREYYASLVKNEPDASPAEVYGNALAAMQAGDAKKAVSVFRRLRDANPNVMQYHTALGQAQLANRDYQASLATFEDARKLFPRNVAVTVRFAEALMQRNENKRAHELLLDLFNTVPPTPEQCRLIALAANAAGDVADSYYYMSEYHIMSGDLPLAMNQLQLALAVPELSSVQKARFQARLDEIREAMPKKMRREMAPRQG